MVPLQTETTKIDVIFLLPYRSGSHCFPISPTLDFLPESYRHTVFVYFQNITGELSKKISQVTVVFFLAGDRLIDKCDV